MTKKEALAIATELRKQHRRVYVFRTDEGWMLGQGDATQCSGTADAFYRSARCGRN